MTVHKADILRQAMAHHAQGDTDRLVEVDASTATARPAGCARPVVRCAAPAELLEGRPTADVCSKAGDGLFADVAAPDRERPLRLLTLPAGIEQVKLPGAGVWQAWNASHQIPLDHEGTQRCCRKQGLSEPLNRPSKKPALPGWHCSGRYCGLLILLKSWTWRGSAGHCFSLLMQDTSVLLQPWSL